MEKIGSILSLEGRVTGVDDAGQARVLKAGDSVHFDETLVAALGATATVRLETGIDLCIESGRMVVLDADVLGDEDGVDNGAVRLTDLDLVLGSPLVRARSSAA